MMWVIAWVAAVVLICIVAGANRRAASDEVNAAEDQEQLDAIRRKE